ncbi:MAG TPA: GAF domain-containing protein [Anaerolineae bacterium]|nr:GAF domain-containing protein [Anaerolineae bacterium]
MVDQQHVPLVADILTWRQELIRRVLRVMLFFGGLMTAVGAYTTYSRGLFWAMEAYIGVYGILVLLTLWRQAPYTLQVGGIQLILYTISVIVFVTRGLGDSSRVYLLTMIFLSALFLGQRAAILTIGLVIATMVGMSWVFISGRLIAVEVVSTDVGAWIPLSVELVSMGVFIMLLVSSYTSRFNTYVTRSRELSHALEANQADLEAQVVRRTADLEKRSRQLEAATAVAREATTIQDVGMLLQRAAQLISDYFGFYHAGIFLIDEVGKYAVLRAASSEEGQRLLARGHRLSVGEVGLVGYVTQTGESRIAQGGAAAMGEEHPEMPATRSQMALPLQVRGKVIGALDVQSVEPEAFTQEDLHVLQTLADQLAVAIENARLIAESQATLDAAQRAYGEVSRLAWQEILRNSGRLAARYDPHGLLLGDAPLEVTDLRSPTARPTPEPATPSNVLAVPLKTRGQVIGELTAYVSEAQPLSADQHELLETLTEQLGVALESARLYQDTQRRAAQERLVGEVTSHIRESLNIETVLKTTASEIRQALDLDMLTIRLAMSETDDAAGSG